MEKGSSGARKRAIVVGVALAIACGTTGCRKLFAKLKGEDAGVITAASEQEEADEQLQRKVDEYIGCLNALSSASFQSRHHYLSSVPPTGPSGREVEVKLTPLPASAAETCSAGVARAKTMPPPRPDLEAAGERFAKAARDLDALIREADRYYAATAFRDDDWTKGKALHPRLMDAWSELSAADIALHGALDGITKPLAERVLGRIEREDGKRFLYYRKKTLVAARELVEAGDPAGDDDDVDFELYSAAYATFEGALDELQAYGTAHKAELADRDRAPSWPVADSNYGAFITEASAFKKASKELWRCLRDAPTKAKTPSGKIDLEKVGRCSDGTAYEAVASVVERYNTLVRTANEQQFP
jgi:hypothetical protein